MYKEKDSILFAGLLFLLLPYLLTVVLAGRSACPVSREIPLEEYVPAVTASQIPWDYSKEVIKAQTIIARNYLYLVWQEGEQEALLDSTARFMKEKNMNDAMLQKYQVFQEAAAETRGQVMRLEGAVKFLPYHQLNQGRTRNGKEILGEHYQYIASVETAEDINSPLLVEGCYFSCKELEKKIKEVYPGFVMNDEKTVEIKAADSTGYVMEIQIGNQEFQGEKIREILELPSSCFTVQKLENEVRFLCKGIGHGLGMSQYSAQQMAAEGKNYKEILHYFFPELEIEEYEK